MSVYPVKKVESDSDILDFKWKKNLRAEKYNIQIALNESFEKTGSIKEEDFFIDEETTTNQFQFTGFDLNVVYYWRIRPYYDGKWMNWYKTEHFEVQSISDVIEFKNEVKINLYPNPATEYFEIETNLEVIKMKLYSI
jgi:hypothetical protein